MFKNIKENDMYRFYPNDMYRNSCFEYNHCFEGLFHATKNKNGEFILIDTFWSHFYNGAWNHSWDMGKKWDLETATKNGEFKLICNMEDIEPIEKYYIKYYKDEDIIKLTNQHGCTESCVYRFKRKGAEKDNETILNYLIEQLENKEYALESTVRDIENLKEKIKKVKSGDINDIYI